MVFHALTFGREMLKTEGDVKNRGIQSSKLIQNVLRNSSKHERNMLRRRMICFVH